MVYISFNLANYGPIIEKMYPQKLVTKNHQTPPPPPYPQKLVTGGTQGTPPLSSDIVTTFALFLILWLPLLSTVCQCKLGFIKANDTKLPVIPSTLLEDCFPLQIMLVIVGEL